MNPQLRQMMERYLAGDLSEIEVEAFLTLIRNDVEALGELKQAMLQQAMLYDLLRRPQERKAADRKGSRVSPAVGTTRLRSGSTSRTGASTEPPAGLPTRPKAGAEGRSGQASSVRKSLPPSGIQRFKPWQLGVAAAAILLVTLGALAFWMETNSSHNAALEEQQARRRQAILRQLAELEKEAAATRFVPPPPKIDPVVVTPAIPTAPAAGEPSEVVVSDPEAMRREAETERRREADEAARMIEARRQQLLAEIGRIPDRRPNRDEAGEEALPVESSKPDAAPVVASAPARTEIGRVVFVGDERKSGVVVRGEPKEEIRLELREGLRLNRGDRVETTGGEAPACAVLELTGGATLDLDRKTVIEVVDSDEARLSTGRIYACISRRDYSADLPSAPFSLQTKMGRYLTEEVHAEIVASPEFTTPLTTARIDNGKLHLVNAKGVVAGYKGQEVQSLGHLAPQRTDGFTSPIWRGRDLPTQGLPIGKGNLLIWSNENPMSWFTEDYAMLLAHRGEIRLAGIQASQGNSSLLTGIQAIGLEKQFQLLARETNQLANKFGLRNLPQPTMGAPLPLVKPASGKPEETRAETSAAVMQILAGARAASPKQPLVVACTGSLTDVACAWLLDHGIAERVVVVGPFLAAGIEWQFDPWAAEIVLRHFRCVLGSGPALTLDQKRLARMTDRLWAKRAAKAAGGDPEFCKLGFVVIPGFITEVTQARFTGTQNGAPQFEPDPQGRIWQVQNTNAEALLREFDQTFLRPSR